MQIKLLEIRDEGTHVPAIAISISTPPAELSRREYDILARAGYGPTSIIADDSGSEPMILLGFLIGGRKMHYDPYNWDTSTMMQAHLFLQRFWKHVKSGDLICVETILGKRALPKPTELTSDAIYTCHPKPEGYNEKPA